MFEINISPSSVAKFPLLWTAGVEFDTFVGHFHGVHSQRQDQPTVDLPVWLPGADPAGVPDRLGGDQGHQRGVRARAVALLSGVVRGQYGVVQRAGAGHLLAQHRHRGDSGADREVSLQGRCHQDIVRVHLFQHSHHNDRGRLLRVPVPQHRPRKSGPAVPGAGHPDGSVRPSRDGERVGPAAAAHHPGSVVCAALRLLAGIRDDLHLHLDAYDPKAPELHRLPGWTSCRNSRTIVPQLYLSPTAGHADRWVADRVCDDLRDHYDHLGVRVEEFVHGPGVFAGAAGVEGVAVHLGDHSGAVDRDLVVVDDNIF
uniref:(northern house mosquito) hypothetical protein n=1 Tax=Culex pipiens TaxID=7175 RepID=A0A8D8E090_CULPI